MTDDRDKTVDELLEELRVLRARLAAAGVSSSPAIDLSTVRGAPSPPPMPAALASALPPRGSGPPVRPASDPQTRTLAHLRLLEAAVDHLHDIVFITEAEPPPGGGGRRIVFVNRAFEQATGYRADEVIGKTPNMTVGPKTDRATLQRIEARLRERRPVHEEVLKYRKDGGCYWVELDIVPVWDEQGRHTHWVSIQRDITERKAIELQLVEAERQAVVGSVVASLGRELGVPLAKAVGALDRVYDQIGGLNPNLRGSNSRPPPPPARASSRQVPTVALRAAGAAARSGEHLETYLAAGAAHADAQQQQQPPTREELYVRARRATQEARAAIEKARGVLTGIDRLMRDNAPTSAPVDVREVLDAAVNMVQRQLRNHARLERDYYDVPRVAANAARLAQVFVQLLTNATEAMPPGEPGRNRVRVSVRAVPGERGVQVEIQDNGRGVPAHVRERLFTPFFTTRSAHEGLGLSTSQEYLRTIDGQITLESEPGRGTVVRILLRAAVVQ